MSEWHLINAVVIFRDLIQCAEVESAWSARQQAMKICEALSIASSPKEDAPGDCTDLPAEWWFTGWHRFNRYDADEYLWKRPRRATDRLIEAVETCLKDRIKKGI